MIRGVTTNPKLPMMSAEAPVVNFILDHAVLQSAALASQQHRAARAGNIYISIIDNNKVIDMVNFIIVNGLENRYYRV